MNLNSIIYLLVIIFYFTSSKVTNIDNQLFILLWYKYVHIINCL